MATFIATTTSNNPRLKNPKAAQKILDRYIWDGDLQALIVKDQLDRKSRLALYGYDWPGAWRIPDDVNNEDFEPDYNIDSFDGFEHFLHEIAPFLAEPLTVQAVGFEKCRFPLAAAEWHIKPNSTKITANGFRHPRD